jgi:protein-S-isoprenylcysteine O-methyltransferase Ste14
MKTLICKFPPMLVSLLAGVLMWVISAISPSFTVLLPFRSIIFIFTAIAGIAIVFSSGHSFTNAKTSFNPIKFDKVTSLVTTGIYSFTRNPMYLGVMIVFAGWAYYLGNIFAVMIITLNIIYLNCFQIKQEETVLEEKFGQEYLSYKSRVRRWI